jgi:hypothetical protein
LPKDDRKYGDKSPTNDDASSTLHHEGGCDFRRPTAHILDTAPINVYEELNDDAYDLAGNLVVNLARCAFEGGLFKKRSDYIKTAHLVYPSEAQLVNTKCLHQTCHYSIGREQLPEFLETARRLAVPVEHYHRDRSFLADPQAFLRIYNFGTDAFTKIEPLFNELAFERTARAISTEYETEKRGNIQGSFGVSALSMNQRNRLGVAVPQLKACTSKQVDNFLVMSKLSEVTTTYENPPLELVDGEEPSTDYYTRFQEEQHSPFARAIDEDNIHEGLTDGGYLEWDRLFAHCDTHNCFLQHRHGVILCSRVVMERVKNGTASPFSQHAWTPRRLIVIAYMRKVVSDFARRQSRHAPVVALVKDFYLNEIPEWRREITRDFVTDGWDEVLEGGVLSRPCNMDKMGWYAPFIDALFNFTKKFQPTLEDLCDIGVLIPALSESSIFPRVLNHWVEQGQLPEGGCLAEAFADTAIELFGSFACGPCPRKQVCLKSELKKTSHDKSRRNFYREVRHLNEEVDVRETSTKSQCAEFSSSVDRLSRPLAQGGLYYTTDLGAQHLLVIFVGAGIIHHPSFLAQARISTKTETAKRLREQFGLSDSDFPLLLQAISHALCITPQKAENVLCEALRQWQKTDLYIPGQWIYRLRDTRGNKPKRGMGGNHGGQGCFVVERFHPLNKNVPPEEVPAYCPANSTDEESENWRPFFGDRPDSSFRTMKPSLVRKRRAFKSIFFRTVEESVAYARSAQHTLFNLKGQREIFRSTHGKHPLATNDRRAKKKPHHAFFLRQLQRGGDKWLDLVCRLRPFSLFVNEERLHKLGHFNEKTMRTWVDRPPINRRKRKLVSIERPSDYRPPQLQLNETEREHVRSVKRRIVEATSVSSPENTRTLFTERDRLTGSENGKPKIKIADIRGWVFDRNEPHRIAKESAANGFKETPTNFGARVYRPRSKKAIPGLTCEPASDLLRRAAKPNRPPLSTSIRFDKESVGEKLYKALTDQSAWKYPPTLREWSKGPYCIEDFLRSPASCPRTDKAHCFDLGMVVRALVGRFRIHYLDISGHSRGRAYAAFLERMDASSSCDTKRIVLGSLPEVDPTYKYAHPRGLVHSLSGTHCMGAMTPPHFYEDKQSARTALFFYILLNFVGEDPSVRYRTIRNMIFRKYSKSTVLVNAHTGKATDDVCSCLFHVDDEEAVVLLPAHGTGNGTSTNEDDGQRPQPVVLAL